MNDASASLTKHLNDRIEFFRSWPVTRRATVTVQSLAPLHIGSGSETDESDAGVILDANGLATLPGSSIKGVIRAAYRNASGLRDDDPQIAQLFGYQRGGDGQGARIRITWGRVHDQFDRPISGLLAPSTISADPVLQSAAAPELRDHARLSGRGVAENKFDEISVIAGHRFTFHIEMIGDDSESDRTAWARLLAILRRNEIRLGGKTRRGFGSMRLARLMADPDDTSGSAPEPLEILHDLRLQPDQDCFWMFGGGADLGDLGTADDAPVRASRVVWSENNSGSVEREILVIPGSSIKGPLRHRTLYHLARQLGEWAESSADAPFSHRALHLLFGDVSLDPSRRNNTGRTENKDVASVGRIFIDDIYLEKEDGAEVVRDQQNHVTIDRVTGGAFDHHLFTDRPLHSGGFRLVVRYERPRPDALSFEGEKLLDQAITALGESIHDLSDGRLALGAYGSRGYGWFRQTDSQPH